MSSIGTTTSSSIGLRCPASTIVDGPRRAVVGVPAEEARDRLERPLRRRQADPLRRLVGERLESLEREREVRAALRARERVDLVDDHGRDAAQRLARRRREHQVERLGRRDQDVGRVRQQLPALARRRVARAHPDHRLRARARRRRRSAAWRDAGERRAEVLLDVDRERAQRRDVEDARAAFGSGGGGSVASRSIAHRNAASVLPEPVGASTRVWSPVGDRRPAPRLRGGGRVERRLEPCADGGGEGSRLTPATLARNADMRQRPLPARVADARDGRMRPCRGRSSLRVSSSRLVALLGGLCVSATLAPRSAQSPRLDSPSPSAGADVASDRGPGRARPARSRCPADGSSARSSSSTGARSSRAWSSATSSCWTGRSSSRVR